MLKIWFFASISFSLVSFACAEKLNPDPTKRYTLNVLFTAMPQG